jgi:hypothetical protein
MQPSMQRRAVLRDAESLCVMSSCCALIGWDLPAFSCFFTFLIFFGNTFPIKRYHAAQGSEKEAMLDVAIVTTLCLECRATYNFGWRF